MGEDMTQHHTLSRRSLLQRGAIAGIALIGASGAVIPSARSVFAQNGDIELVAISDGIRVRAEPGLSGAIRGSVSTGDVVNQIGGPVSADGYEWIQVSVQANRNLTGWAASEFFERAGGTAGWKPGNDVHVNSDDVNLRSGPGLGNGAIASYDFGTNAVIVSGPTNADGYAWFQIDVSDGTRGWMASSFLSPGRSSSGSGWPAGTRVHVNDDNVNLRNNPGLGSTVIGTFDSGTNAGVIGGPQTADGFDWYNIGIGGLQGWMAANFLSRGEAGQVPGWQSGSYVRTTSDLNLRTGPGTGYNVIDVYPTGEIATIISGPRAAEGYTWYEVEMWSDSNVGWFAGEFLEGARFEPTGSRLEVVDGPLNLRQSPTVDSPIVTTLPTGDVVVIRDASFVSDGGYTWANVYVERNPDLVGWVAREFTQEIG